MKKKKLTEEQVRAAQAKTDKVTRVVALAFVFVAVYYFFIKLVFL